MSEENRKNKNKHFKSTDDNSEESNDTNIFGFNSNISSSSSSSFINLDNITFFKYYFN
jgi:hypothetical protein